MTYDLPTWYKAIGKRVQVTLLPIALYHVGKIVRVNDDQDQMLNFFPYFLPVCKYHNSRNNYPFFTKY
jgi:hypothetical protein